MTIQVLLPMGGLGTRFSNAGYEIPKPLIEVDGVPMYRKAMSSFDSLNKQIEFFAVVRQEHEDLYGLGSALEQAGVKSKFIMENTRGAAETALYATSLLQLDQPLVVVDCDLYFRSPQLMNELEKEELPFVGALTYFQSKDPRYSYAELDNFGNVTRTAEKDPISTNALIGCYTFRSAEVFKNAAQKLISNGLGSGIKEFYMSLIFNYIIDQGDSVRGYPGSFDSFGTPEELDGYLLRQKG